MDPVRVLFLADTHLGFDMPFRPRIRRRRRGPDFFENFRRALEPALHGKVNLVVHGGDLLYRARVGARLVQTAMQPLLRVADRGVDVFIVPGNHERSRIPYPLLTRHAHVHVFDRPRTFVRCYNGWTLAVAGFPYHPRMAGRAFARRLEATRWRETRAQIRILCMHQIVQGARVGVQDYVFRSGGDVVPARDIPKDFAAVLAGHVHRWQMLSSPAAPVLYPGSIERTSFAERNEAKGFLLLELTGDEHHPGGRLLRWDVVALPARPMVSVGLDLYPDDDAISVASRLQHQLALLDPHAIVRIQIQGRPSVEVRRVIGAASLRNLAPSTMNVSVSWPDLFRRGHAALKP